MIDSLINNLSKKTDIITRLGLSEYCLVTMHRPSNVDNKEKLVYILDILNNLPFKVVWPIHPRTLKNIDKFELKGMIKEHIILEPLGYLDFITLVSECKLVLTDSGGIQEETTYLGIPCITMRDNTERPSTITVGTNQLLNDKKEILNAIKNLNLKKHSIPPLWDGKASERITNIIRRK
jgi:UDP-N-acetylglucosamine 2-epimerase (non-hydrolysing)